MKMKFLNVSFFHKDTLELNIQKKTSIKMGDYKIQKTHAWESLFRPLIDFSSSLPRIPELNKNRLDNLLEALKFGLQEYASKCGFKNFSSGPIWRNLTPH